MMSKPEAYIGILFFSCFINLELTGQHIQNMQEALSEDNVRTYIETLADFETRHSLSDTVSDERGIGAARRWVHATFSSFNEEAVSELDVYFDSFVVSGEEERIPETILMNNVVAKLPSSDPTDDRVLIISAHLDSRASNVMNDSIRAPGANDDASGVAALMEIARVMSRYEFPATIYFVAFSGEEQGLFGSTHFANSARQKDWNIIAVLNNDMIGNSHSSGTNLHNNTRVRVFSEAISPADTEREATIRRYVGGENDGHSRQLARYVERTGEQYVDQLDVVMIYRNDRYLRGGDHTPFVREGFPAVRICEMNEHYRRQHQDVRIENGIQYGDLPEFIDYDYLMKNTALNLSILAALAMAPPQPEHVMIDATSLTNFTTMNWSPPDTDRVAKYRVFMRPTHQSQWTDSFETRDTSITLPYSKDNFLFGVQSVSREGAGSVPVFPDPNW